MCVEITKCPVKDLCGGCTLQDYSYESQLSHKLKIAKNALEINGTDPAFLSEIVPAPSPYRYRNKMEYTFGNEYIDGPLNLGMHQAHRFMSVIEAGECRLVPEDFNIILNATLKFCRERGYSFYHKKRHEGLLRTLTVRHGVRTKELLVNIVTSSQSDFDEEAYKKLILETETDSRLVGLLHTVNDSVSDAFRCDEMRILYGRNYYMEEIMGLKFRVGALSFFQSNVEAAERLYLDALSLIDGIEGKTVYDLYCGTGTITQAAAAKAKEAIGVEIVRDAVDSAIANAKINGLENCRFICGDVLSVLDSIDEKPDVIIVDPPRAGIHPKAMEKILSYGVKQIVYVSCNPKSLAVNLKACPAHGYIPVSIKCYDNFSFTEHVETVALLSKVKG